jgi:hypothetical protein
MPTNEELYRQLMANKGGSPWVNMGQAPALDLSGIVGPSADMSAPIKVPAQQAPQLTPVSTSTKTTTKTSVPFSQSPEVKTLLEQMRTNRLQSREGQISGITGLEDVLKQHMERQQGREGLYGLDLTPLMALTDQWTGSKFAQSYNRPEDSKAQLETTARLQDALQRAKGELTQADMDALKAELGTIYKDKDLEQQSTESKARLEYMKSQAANAAVARGGKEDTRARENYNKEFGNSISAMGEFMSSAKDVKDILLKNGRVPDFNSPDYTKYKSAVDRMIVRYNSDVAKLGALAGADLTLLSGATASSPEMLKTWFNEKLQGGVGGTVQVLDSLEKQVDTSVNDYGDRAGLIWGESIVPLYQKDKELYFKKKQGTFGGSNKEKTSVLDKYKGVSDEELLMQYNALQGK